MPRLLPSPLLTALKRGYHRLFHPGVRIGPDDKGRTHPRL